MSSVPVLPLGNYSSGTYGPLGPVAIADDVTSVDFNFQSCTTATPAIFSDPATTLEVIPEVSADGGVTYSEAGRFKINGGIHLSKFGLELPWVRGGGSLPAGTNRLYQVTAIIENGPLRTQATVEIN